MSWNGLRAAVRSIPQCVTKRILAHWYMPCTLLGASGCFFPLPLIDDVEPNVSPQITLTQPEDGESITLDPVGRAPTILVEAFDGDGDEIEAHWFISGSELSGETSPGAEGSVDYTLELDWDDFQDDDGSKISITVSDGQAQDTAQWFLSVLGGT